MLPNFLCIGAQKSGTTWLYTNIRHHPDIWMPPSKEIHYFDDVLPLPSIVSVFNPRTFWPRKTVIQRLLQPRHATDIQNRRWYLRFLFLPRTEAWYASMFSPGRGQIAGDITPTYATIKESRIARARALMPNAKIIYLIRNPIHRTWSQTAMHFELWWGRNLQAVQGEQIERYLDRKSYTKDSDYLSNLEAWERFFPRCQLHIAFFDQLVQNPQALLRDIYRFLELDASEQFIPEIVSRRRNQGHYPAIPNDIARRLANQYHKQIERLHCRFDNRHTASWLKFARAHL